MKRRAFVRPRAESDLISLGWYVGLPEAFLRAAKETVRQLARTPELGGPWPMALHSRRSNIRVWAPAVEKFGDNYLIFYEPTEQGIEVIRVLHRERDIDRV